MTTHCFPCVPNVCPCVPHLQQINAARERGWLREVCWEAHNKLLLMTALWQEKKSAERQVHFKKQGLHCKNYFLSPSNQRNCWVTVGSADRSSHVQHEAATWCLCRIMQLEKITAGSRGWPEICRGGMSRDGRSWMSRSSTTSQGRGTDSGNTRSGLKFRKTESSCKDLLLQVGVLWWAGLFSGSSGVAALGTLGYDSLLPTCCWRFRK